MTRGAFDRAVVAAFMAGRYGASIDASQIEVHPLQGGISSAVVLVTARLWDGSEPRRVAFVVKLVDGATAREADVYRKLATSAARSFSPELLGAQQLGTCRWLLYLERIVPAHRWPWTDNAHTARVLDHLATLHEEGLSDASLPGWDYEAELLTSARATLELAERLRRSELTALARTLPALRRVVDALPAMRRQLLSYEPLGSVVIHGDLHPGNVLVRKSGGLLSPVLLDWGRARSGSPLEDVSSWLQALGYWEPEAKRRHDTLLAGYLAARDLSPVLTGPLRDVYWFAASSNVLAGALGYHLSEASRAGASRDARASAARNAADWLRVIRRADARWR